VEQQCKSKAGGGTQANRLGRIASGFSKKINFLGALGNEHVYYSFSKLAYKLQTVTTSPPPAHEIGWVKVRIAVGQSTEFGQPPVLFVSIAM